MCGEREIGSNAFLYGDLPYMPRAAVWPAPFGLPANFVGQLSFVDSRGLVPDLPGDVLVLFDTRWYEAAKDTLDEDYENHFVVYWFRLGDFDLVTVDDVPDAAEWAS